MYRVPLMHLGDLLTPMIGRVENGRVVGQHKEFVGRRGDLDSVRRYITLLSALELDPQEVMRRAGHHDELAFLAMLDLRAPVARLRVDRRVLFQGQPG